MPPHPGRSLPRQTAYWLGFASAYAVAALLFGLYLAATNPKAAAWETVREGVTWPVTMVRDILGSGWLHAAPGSAESCRGRAACDVG